MHDVKSCTVLTHNCLHASQSDQQSVQPTYLDRKEILIQISVMQLEYSEWRQVFIPIACFHVNAASVSLSKFAKLLLF